MSPNRETPGRKRTLLIVDDQQGVRLSLSFLLDGAGYRTISADSCAAALLVAEREEIDGALIYVHMPGQNGFETCLRLRAHAASIGRDLPVWFMTGAGSQAVLRRCEELGGLGVLGKPFDFEDLLTRLKSEFFAAVASKPAESASNMTP